MVFIDKPTPLTLENTPCSHRERGYIFIIIIVISSSIMTDHCFYKTNQEQKCVNACVGLVLQVFLESLVVRNLGHVISHIIND